MKLTIVVAILVSLIGVTNGDLGIGTGSFDYGGIGSGSFNGGIDSFEEPESEPESEPLAPEPEPEPQAPEPAPEPVVEPQPAPTPVVQPKVYARLQVTGAVSVNTFVSALADEMEGIDATDIEVTAFEMNVVTSASLPCSSNGFTEAMQDDFKAGVRLATGATDVTIDSVSGCDRRRRMTEATSRRRLADADIDYTVKITEASAADSLAVIMANTTSFSESLITQINAGGGLGGSTLSASDISVATPTIETAITYEVAVPSTGDSNQIKDIASDSATMLDVVQTAAAAVPISQTIDASDLETTAQFTPIPVEPEEEEEDDLLWLWILIAVLGSLCLLIMVCCMCPGQICSNCRDSMGFGGCGPCLDDDEEEPNAKYP